MSVVDVRARAQPGAPAPVPSRDEGQRRTAVIDLGSNSFRLVVFTAVPGGWWRRSDEIHEAVRIGQGLDAIGALQPAPMERALQALVAYAHFCHATGLRAPAIHPVATSAIRDAGNRTAFLERARHSSDLAIRVLSTREEAWYGFLAAVNSSTIGDGVVLDLGGGSMQLVQVRDRRARDLRSWPLGAVRMTERFLPDGEPARKRQLRALREHVLEAVASAPWLREGGRLVGLGGTLRNLAAAAEAAAGLPSFGVQGFRLRPQALDELVEELAARPAAERGQLRGIKPERGDIILAGAVVVQTLLHEGAFDAAEVTEFGLREGVFLEAHLGGAEPPVLGDVRTASVRNLALSHLHDLTHSEHVAWLASRIWDALAAAGLHPGDPEERELLWAGGLLHDIGIAIDYDDHHKHSRYVILSAGLPGYDPRQTALIAQLARYHRKGTPSLGEAEPLARPGDAEGLRRTAAVLRLAEQLERARDQVVRDVVLDVRSDEVVLDLRCDGDHGLAAWAAARQGELFESAFERRLRVVG